MNFLNPLALFGLFAAAIPIVIHFLNLRKLKKIEFSTLKFLKELQKTKIRNLKIKQWLILLLRTLAVLFAIITLARPTIEGTIPGFDSTSKTSSIIIIDNSFSMDLSDESGNRFTQARNTATSIINSLKSGDEAAILTVTDKLSEQSSGFSNDFQFLKERLSKIKITNQKGNIESILKYSLGLFEKSKNINQEIFIISDAQNNLFIKDLIDSSRIKDKISVYFSKIGNNASDLINNVSIDSINVINRIFQYDKPVELEVLVRNNSSKNLENLVISLFFNNKRTAQRNLNLKAKESKFISISALPKEYGVIKSRVSLEDDALNIDNHRHFGFLIPDKPKVVVFSDQKEYDFLKLMLSESINSESPSITSFLNSSRLQGTNLSEFDIVILTGSSFSESDYSKLKSYIQQGGSAIIFGADYKTQSQSSTFPNNLGLGSLKIREYPDDAPGVFTNLEKVHPLFEGVFTGTTDNKKIVESPKIYKSVIITEGLELIKMTGGSFLKEIQVGDGKLFFFAVPPNAEWSTFPLTGIFPTIIYRSIVYLSSNEGLSQFIETSQTFKSVVSSKDFSSEQVKVIDPKDKVIYYPLVNLPSGNMLIIHKLVTPGVYSLLAYNDKTVGIFSVNVPASESLLNYYDDKNLEQYFAFILSNNSSFNILDNKSEIMNSVYRLRTGTELWQLFLILAVLCLVTEMIISKNSKRESLES